MVSCLSSWRFTVDDSPVLCGFLAKIYSIFYGAALSLFANIIFYFAHLAKQRQCIFSSFRL